MRAGEGGQALGDLGLGEAPQLAGPSQVIAGVANVFRIADGKIVEHLAFATELDTLRQLGAPLQEPWLALMHRAPEMELRAT